MPGALSVYANQTVTITGTASPLGQLPLLDASISVAAAGTLSLVGVHLTQQVIVDNGGMMQTSQSEVPDPIGVALRLPVEAPAEFPECRPDRAGNVVYSTASGTPVICSRASGEWDQLSTLIYDGSNFDAFYALAKSEAGHSAPSELAAAFCLAHFIALFPQYRLLPGWVV